MIEKIVNHDNSWNHHHHQHQQQLKQHKMMGRRRNHIKSNGNAERVQSYRSGSIDTVDDDVDDDDGDVDDDVDVKDEPWNRQSVRTESTIYHKTDCASLHNHNNGSIVTMMATGMASVKAVVSLVATVSDDGSELTCLARNNLISDHGKWWNLFLFLYMILYTFSFGWEGRVDFLLNIIFFLDE